MSKKAKLALRSRIRNIIRIRQSNCSYRIIRAHSAKWLSGVRKEHEVELSSASDGGLHAGRSTKIWHEAYLDNLLDALHELRLFELLFANERNQAVIRKIHARALFCHLTCKYCTLHCTNSVIPERIEDHFVDIGVLRVKDLSKLYRI